MSIFNEKISIIGCSTELSLKRNLKKKKEKMVYKKYVKKRGKIFGPYYYESYRDGYYVRKRYIGDKKEYREWLKKKRNSKIKQKTNSFFDNFNKKGKNFLGFFRKSPDLKKKLESAGKVVEQSIIQHNSDKGKILFNIFLILSIFLVIISFIFVFFIIQGFNIEGSFTGFAIGENVSNSINTNLLYGSFENERIIEDFDTEHVDLSIKEPEKFNGKILNKNKNERMDFQLQTGNLRLYFQLLNYSEFVENAEDLIINETTPSIILFDETITQINESEINITEQIVNETKVINNTIIINETQIINETTIIEEPIINKSQEEEIQEQNLTEIQIPFEQTNESEQSAGITNNIIKSFYGFFGLIGRVIGIDFNENNSDIININNSNENLNNIDNSNIDLDEIKYAVDNLEEEKINEISENSVIEAEDFEINVSSIPEKNQKTMPNYKWGYKLKLKDLKFMAKIDVTTDRDITIIDNQTLKIGNTLLSFSDLVNAGYKIRIGMPSLEIPIENIPVIVNITKNITEQIRNITETNETIINITTINQTETNITGINITTNVTIPVINETISNITAVNETEVINETIIEEPIINESQEQARRGEKEETGEEKQKGPEEETKGEKKEGKREEKQGGVKQEEIKEEKQEEKVEQTEPSEQATTPTEQEQAPAEVPPEQSEQTITGNVIKNIKKITGKIVGVTGKIIENIVISNETIEDLQYPNTISVYIERDFSEINNLMQDTEREVGSNENNADINVNFEDLDNNNKISIGDIIELDPSLIILITKAEHLDKKREFISDIYEHVKTKDNNWSEEIKKQEYVRVTFEQNLTKGSDITIFARSKNNKTAEIEVYKEDDDNPITKFENITSENWYRVYLSNLSEGECYDNETEILTENGWKLFKDLYKGEKVMTLNAETGEKEWQLPVEKQIYDNNGEMYKVLLEDENGKESELVVSKEHKVYAAEKWKDYNNLNSFINSSVVNILILDCSLNASSSDQIGVLSNNKDKAKYGSSSTSSKCGDILLASDKNLEYLPFLNVLTDFFNKENKKSNSDSSISENFTILPFLSDISFNTKSGEISSHSAFSNSSITYLLVESDLKNENSIEASAISNFGRAILTHNPCCLATFFFTSLESSEICSSVNLLLDNISLAIENSTFLTTCFNTLAKANSNSLLNSVGISNFMQNSSSIKIGNNKDYKKLSVADFSLQKIAETYEEINNGKELYFLNAENKPIKIKNIEKVPYSGKIYDVDVPNDIVLVKRKNSSEVWSGNSNSVFDLKIIDNSVEFDYIVDPTIGATNVSNCQTLSTANTYYQLNTSILNNTITTDCIIISAQNITFDCDGYSINSTKNYTGVYSAQWNTTIKNCNINMGSGANTNAFGIEMTDTADNSNVINNTIIGGMDVGIAWNPSNNGPDDSLIENNTVDVSSVAGSDGIIIRGSLNNILRGNIATSKSVNGILLGTSSNNNTLISNTGTSTSSIGIQISSSSNNTLTSNTGTSNSSYGISINNNWNNTLINNTGTSNSGSGIYLSSSSNNTLINNTGISNSYAGIYLSASNNNTLTNNTGTSNSSRGTYIWTSSNNTLINHQAIGYLSGSSGVYIEDKAYNNIFINCINISGVSNSSGGGGDVYIHQKSGSFNNTFLNCSYRITNESVNGNNTLFRKWYYRAYVNDSNGNAISGANIIATNNTGDIEFNITTNETGWTNITTITDYVNNGTRNYYSPYWINASNITLSSNHTFNASLENNLTDFFTFTVGAPADTTYPLFSNYYDNNATLIDSGLAIFNATILNSNGTVLFEINNTNYTTNNLTLTTWNYSLRLTNGTYTYRWHSWGNGTNKNFNTSGARSYTVNTSYPQINFTVPTPANATSTTNTSIEINVSISDNAINEIKYNWNGTNYTFYNDSLVLMFNFDNKSELGEGTSANRIIDISLLNITANCTNMPSGCNISSGKYGNSIGFDGTNDYVLTSAIKPSLPLSICFWVNSNSANPVGIFDSAPGVGDVLRNYNSGVVEWWDQCPGVNLGLSAGIWIHLCFVYSHNGTNRIINWSKNGIPQTPGSCVGTNNFEWTTLRLGDINTGNAGRFSGYLDNFMIWNRSLTYNEMYQLYISNFEKFNSTQWYLYVNQSKNATTGLDVGNYTYFASAKDSAGNENVSETRTITISAVDTSYPLFSSYWDNNASIYSGGVALFNVTINNTNTTVWLTINNANYTASNLSASVYNVSVSGLSNGTYSYNWSAYGNGTSKNLNTSDTRSYTINSTSATQLIDCMNLTTANTTYTLVANIINNTIVNDCVIVKAQNITLDCQGYSISSTQNYTGVYSNQWNTTIKNCNISMGSGGNTNAIGIEMTDAADFSSVINNTIIGEMDYGISFAPSNNGPENSLIENNTINVSASYANGTSIATTGIYLRGAGNNVLRGNNASTFGEYGLELISSSNNVIVENIVTSNSSDAIYIASSPTNNLTRNTGTSNSGQGIEIASSNNNILDANVVVSSMSYALYINSNNNILTNNIGTSNSSNSGSNNFGIYIRNADNNTLINNTGISMKSFGIYFIEGSDNNNLTGNTGTSNSSYAVYLQDSHNNTLTNQNATGYLSGSRGIAFRNANNNTIQDCINISGFSGDVLYVTATSSNNTFINCSYRTTGTNETVLAGGDLIRKWYYRAYVNDSSGTAVSNANVSAYNVSGSQEFAGLMTNSSGWTNRTEITEYVNVGGTRVYYNNYNINATYGASVANSSGYNVTTQTNNLAHNLQFSNTSGVTSTCMNLTSAGLTYTLSSNIVNDTITADCIIFKNQNITLDCVGYYISSTQNYTGVYSNQWNTTIKNCNVSMGQGNNTNSIGIEMTDAADYSSVVNNTIIGGGMMRGIDSGGSSGFDNSLIENNSISVTCVNCVGIYLWDADNNLVRGNNASALSGYGIRLDSSTSNNTLINNIASSNSSYGISFSGATNNNLTSNTGTSNSSYGIYLYSSSNNTLTSNTGTSTSSYGIYLVTSSNNNLTSNTGTSNSSVGIYLNSASNNTLTSNTGTSNSGTSAYGIAVGGSINNNLMNNIGFTNASIGIYVSTSNNTILTNNTGTAISASGSYPGGISVYNSLNITLINNTGISNSTNGIYLWILNNSIITGNTGTSNSSVGIYLNSASNNNLTSNTGTSNSSYGIYLYLSSNNNTLTSNTGTSNSSYGIYLFSSSNNNIYNQTAIGYLSGSRGIAFRNANNTIIQDCINVSGFSGDVLYVSATSSNNTFINCSYRITGTNETVLAGGELIRKWYYRAYVNDSSGTAVSNANVSAYNISGSTEFAGLLTNSSGWTNRTTITEYVNTGGTRSYYSNYTINATNSSYQTGTKSENITILTNQLSDVFTLNEATAPVITILYPVNNSNFNITSVEFNASANENLSWCGLSIDNGANLTMTLNASLRGANYTNSSMSQSYHNFTINCNDTSNNLGIAYGINILVDSVAPNVTVVSPVNGNSYNSTPLFNVSSSEEGTGMIVPNLDNSLVSWWRMDDLNASGGVVDYMGCYDNETEILTLEEIDCSLAECNSNNYYCEKTENLMQDKEEEASRKITTDDLMINDDKNQNLNPSDFKYLISLAVVNTSIPNSSNIFSLFSLDQTETFSLSYLNDKADATYGMSFVCFCNSTSAFDLKSCQDLSGIFCIKTSKIFLGNSNSSSEISAFLQISDLCLFNSSNNLEGASNCRLYFISENKTISLTVDSFSKNEYKTLASTINSIYNSPSSFNLLYIPSFASLPSFKESSPDNLEFSNNLFNATNNSCLFVLSSSSDFNAFSNILAKAMSECFDNSSFSSLFISMHISTINKDNKNDYLSFSIRNNSDYDNIDNLMHDGGRDGIKEVSDESEESQQTRETSQTTDAQNDNFEINDKNKASSKKCYFKKWKLFKNLNKNEKVATLNNETGELEWQLPDEWQVYDNNGEMYKILLEDENGKESELVISKEHKVYAGVNQISPFKNIFNKSDVLYTGTSDCFIRCGSLDQIAELVDNANARKSTSSLSNINFNDFSKKSSYSGDLKNSIDSSISLCLISNSYSDKLDLIRHSSLCSFSSDFKNSGAINSALIDVNKYADTEYGFIIENNTLLSNTNFILDYLRYSLFSLGESSESNFSFVSGETSFNNWLNLSFFALLPKSTDHLISSCSSLELNFSINCCLFNNSCLTNSDQTIHDNFSIFDFNSSSNANVIDAIYSLGIIPHFSSSSIFLIITPLATSATFNSGKSFLNLASNSSGTDTVILGIFIPSNIYFNKSNYFNIYKSLYKKKDLSNFSLQKITDVYREINNGKELYFLNAENKPVKIKSIEKIPYSGKIYDVDVPNDIVLVRRVKSRDLHLQNSSNSSISLGDREYADVQQSKEEIQTREASQTTETITFDLEINNKKLINENEDDFYKGAVWSGNSNNGTAVGNAAQTRAGKMGKGMGFDGDGDYVNVGNISPGTNFTIAVWIKPIFSRAWGAIVAEDSQEGFFTRSSGTISIYDGDGAGTGSCQTGAKTANQWYHVIAVSNSTNNSIYVNGQLETICNKTTVAWSIKYIGNDNTNEAFNGTIDDVMIFNRSLTASEIMSLYNATRLQHSSISLADGSHTLNAYTQDLGGNVNSSGVISFDVDNTKPQINFTAPTPANATSTTNTSIEINVSISDNAINEVKYNWNGTNYTFYNDSLVLMMNFENLSALGENSTYVVDVSKYGNNGTAIGGAFYNSSGKFGGAFQFDGVNDIINITDSNSLNISSSGSWGAWVYRTGNSSGLYSRIIEKTKGAESQPYYSYGLFGYNSQSSYSCGVGSGSTQYINITSFANVNINEWTNIMCVYNGSDLFTYRNGILVVTKGGVPASINTYTQPLTIGGRTTDTQPFNGTIDEVRIWNRTLSGEEVYQQYVSNLQKFNQTQWYLYVNQSKNATTGLDVGNYTYFASAKDVAGNENMTESRTLTINAVDNIYPLFSSYWDNNASIYNGGIALFNATINNTNTTVWLTINNANYTASNLTASVYNVSVSGLANGTYSYNWSAYGNGSSKNLNTSDTRSYTINSTTSTQLIDCMNLTTANTTYTLVANIINNTIVNDCVIVKAQNITLDCVGYSISSTQNYTGVYSNQYNTTVKNCNISMGSDGDTNAIGIEMTDAADYSNIINNTIIGEMDYGISFAAGNNGPENSLIENNTINVSASYANGTGIATTGIYLRSASNNILNRNNATTLIGDGIYLLSGSNNNLTSNIGTNNASGSGIDMLSSNNILINNIGISNSFRGINIEDSNNNIFINNTGISTSGIGIYLYGKNNILNNNTGTSNSSVGIQLLIASNNTLTSNTGTSNTNYGIEFNSYLGGSNNNTLINNTATSNTSYAVYLSSSNNNFLNNTRAEGYLSGSRGIAFRNANNTIIQDCINVSGFSGDVLYVTATSSNNTFINCSYRTTGTNETVMAGGSLTRKWYYRAYVNDSSGTAVSNANVSAYNVSGSQEFAGLMTNSSGWTNRTTITEYVNTGGTRSYYSNYTINASNSSYQTGIKSENITILTNQLSDVFTLNEATAPVITILFPINNSNFNITIVEFNASANENLSWCGLSIDNGTNVTMTLNASLRGANYTNSSMSQGYHNFTINCNDTANNLGIAYGINILVDSVAPNVTVVSPVNGNSYNNATPLFNVSSSEEGTGMIVPNLDNSLVSWWRMDDTNGSCYDNETEILTLEEISCGEVDCDDKGVVCEKVGSLNEEIAEQGSDNNGFSNLMYDEGSRVGAESVESKSEEIESDNSAQSTDVQQTIEETQTTEALQTTETLQTAETTTYPLEDNDNKNSESDDSANYGADNLIYNENEEGKESKRDDEQADVSDKAGSKRCYVKKWKYFNELNGNEKVATLNNVTGEMEWQLPSAYQEFDNSKLGGEMYKIETVDENGNNGELVVSEKHRVYINSEISNLSSYNVINLPLKSSDFVSLSNLENADIKSSADLDCGILNQTTENIFSFGNFEESVKCQSLVISTLCSNLENSANLPLDNPLGFEIMPIPFCLRNISNRFFTFSSLRNLTEGDAELDIITTSQEICCILKSCSDMFFSNSWIVFKDFINTHSSLEHFKDLPNHYSCALKCRGSTTNFSVCNNILINFNSHNLDNNNSLYKFFYNKELLNGYKLIKISEIYNSLKEGRVKAEELVFLDENLNKIKISSIKKFPYSGKIYDVDVENDIVLVKRGDLEVWSGNSNSVVDYMGRNNGTAFGNAAQTRAGKMGKGMGFDGSGDYVNANNVEMLNTSGTYSLWVKFNEFGSDGIINANDFDIYTQAGVLLLFRTGSQSEYSYAGLWNTNEWYHIAMTWNSTNSSGYVNGIQKTIGANTGGDISSIAVSIGRTDSDSYIINGTIDDVMIFNRSLTASEIMSLYNATRLSHSSISLADGSHTLNAYTQDLGGNVNSSGVISFDVDTLYPKFSGYWDNNASIYNGGIALFNATINNTNGSVWLTINNANYTASNLTASVYNVSVSGLANGTYSYNWSAYGNGTSKNLNTSDTRSYTINSTSATQLIDCMNLTTTNTTYTLVANIVNNTIVNDCVIVKAQNVTLDCAGYSISSTQNYTGVYSAQWNTTVKNCNISMGQGNNTNSIGIEMTDAADYSTIVNNTIWDNGVNGMYYGISTAAENQNISYNNINVTCDKCIGIYLNSASNNNLIGNNGTSNNNVGIQLNGASINNTLTSNTGTSNSNAGILLNGNAVNSNFFFNNTGISISSYGIWRYYGSNDTLINNFGISNSSYGIYLQSSSNNTLTSNTGTSNSNIGISIQSSSNSNTLTNNIGTSNSSYGIYLYSSSNNTLTSNTGTSNSSYGIYLYSASNNTLTNNTGTSNSSYGIYLQSSSNSYIYNQTAIGYLAGSRGIAFRNANNTIIQDCINISGFSGDVLYVTATSSNNTFINCSYRITGSNETVMAGGDLIRKWYYRAYVNDSSGTAVSNANVSAYNVSGSQEFAGLLTNSSGWTNITTITEYVNTGGTRSYYNNYTINATTTNSSLINASHGYNVTLNTNNLNDYFILNEGIAPIVYLIFPLNNSGDNDGNLSFIYNVSDSSNISNCSLLLNGIINITNSSITKNTDISFNITNLSVGNYNWSVNCTDSIGNIGAGENRIFSVVLLTKFSGNTTNLSAVNISNITNLIIDKSNIGKINFSQSIDLSNGSNIDNNVNISFNRVEVNTTGVSALNKLARLYFYNLSFTNPRALKDGSACPASVCTEVSYSNGVFVYDVTGFSVYSSEETPSEAVTTTATGSGGGSGGGVAGKPKESEALVIENKELDIVTIINVVKTREIEIRNQGENIINVNAHVKGSEIDKIVIIEEKDKLFQLGSNEKRAIELKIIAPEKPGIYTGKIIINNQEVLITINVNTKELLFDASIIITDNFKTINKGEQLESQITLIPMSEEPKLDVILNYFVKDFEGKTLLKESETLLIEGQKTFKKRFSTKNIPPGEYILGLELVYPNGVASSSSHFKIREQELAIKYKFILILLSIFVIIFVLFIILIIRKYKNVKKLKVLKKKTTSKKGLR